MLAWPRTTGTAAASVTSPIIKANSAASNINGATTSVLLMNSATWKYLDNGSDQGSAWINPGFNDSAWKSGAAQLGYGDNDETTKIGFGPNANDKYITSYFRATFNVSGAAAYSAVAFKLLADDGAVVYLNGKEALRYNMPSGAVNYKTLTTKGSTNKIETLSVDPRLLVEGANTIAVEVHQVGRDSSDLSFALEVSGTAETVPPTSVPTTAPTAAPVQPTQPAQPTSAPTQPAGPSTGTFLPANATWKFLDNGSDQGTAWTAASFNDSAWKSGPAKLGYGDGDEATRVSFGPSSSSKYITTYYRTTFTASGVTSLSGLILKLTRDDGAIVYLNGKEAGRSNMPSGTVNYKTTAASNSDRVVEIKADPRLLVEGVNTVAVEVHQVSGSSSDTIFALEILGNGITAPSQPTATPTKVATLPTAVPTTVPTSAPTSIPTSGPTAVPTVVATNPADGVMLRGGSAWKFLDNGSDQGSAWISPSFSDLGWSIGPAQLGYGDGDEATTVSFGGNNNSKHITTYFRTTFSLSNAAAYSSLTAHMVHDDGAIMYINGKEALRANMATGSVNYKTLADHGGSNATVAYPIDARLLVNGMNVVAVEIHQSNPDSSDISFDMQLTGGGGAAVPTAVPTPQSTAQPTVQPTVVPTTQPTVVAPPPSPGGSMFYVSPSGSSSNDGSQSRPWNLQTALNHPSAVKPGATIWLRAGTYKGKFTSYLKGSSSGAITVRAYPGERVTLDGTDKVLVIADSYYVNFWGMEITNTANRRTISSSPGGNDGVFIDKGKTSHHIKFINLIVHDMAGMGFAWWDSNNDSEIYGSLIYYNGVNQFDHGIYSQNKSGFKRITDNFIFDNASHGVHVYGSSSSSLYNYTVQGNTAFNNGSIGYNTTKSSYGSYARNILVGGGAPAQNPVIDSNYAYYPNSGGTNLNLGLSSGSSNARVTNNYLMNSKVIFGGTNSGASVTGNTFWATAYEGLSASKYPSNTWKSSKPTGMQVFVRPNAYEPGRANISIYNWDKSGTVQISASQLGGVQIKSGDRYELHNVQNYYGDVITGTYNGSSLSVPMSGRSVAQPTGLSFKPASTFPEFGGFVLIVIGQ